MPLIHSVGLWTNQLSAMPVPKLQETLCEVESLGYPALWVGEATRGREAFTHATLALSATERLVLATGVASIYARDASAAASAHLLIEEAFPGRFILGLGVSHNGLVTGRGHSYDRPLSAMRRYLEEMAQYVGDAALAPSGARVLAALGPKMVSLARHHADGVHSFLVTPDHTAATREGLGPGKLLAPEQGVVLESDPDIARSILRSDMGNRLRLPNYRNSLLRMGWHEADLDDGGSNKLIDRMYVWGSENTIAARIDEHMSAGADHVALYVMTPDREPPLESWRRLAPMATSYNRQHRPAS